MTEPTLSWQSKMAELYERVDAEIAPHGDLCLLRGTCCDFPRSDHVLYASSVEVAYARDRKATSGGIPSAHDERLCPFWRLGRCQARSIRPLGCRTYFCDPSWDRGEGIYERYHEELKRIGEEAGIDYEYRPWVEAVSSEVREGVRAPEEPSTRFRSRTGENV